MGSWGRVSPLGDRIRFDCYGVEEYLPKMFPTQINVRTGVRKPGSMSYRWVKDLYPREVSSVYSFIPVDFRTVFFFSRERDTVQDTSSPRSKTLRISKSSGKLFLLYFNTYILTVRNGSRNLPRTRSVLGVSESLPVNRPSLLNWASNVSGRQFDGRVKSLRFLKKEPIQWSFRTEFRPLEWTCDISME